MDNCNHCNRTSPNKVIRVQDALIEEITFDNRTGRVTISYGVLGDFNMINMMVVTLLVSRDTIIRDQFGQDLFLSDLRVGMIINAEFSSAMTRSIPPQSSAFRITVINGNGTTNVRVGRVISVDINNRFFTTGNRNNLASQMRFVVTNETTILNRRGNRISLRNLRPGETVRVEHASFQTASIPPQTTAFKVQVL